MEGQGWKPKRPTLSRRCLLSFKTVGLGLFCWLGYVKKIGYS
ncbi:hypothetical protein HMPREF1991_03007 [Hoylesella loescheii DSM 19665 = JCM 12249 = ATCC 15930]|uniref:Uncharacterized protein n=1 Tax=Hoylesella loescheii DSM 19665 = JCM 12249 = ATCC 15930 TaxID=1122985 RepID=A0A069QFW3_HOYLO|nr:hypothetical protein HMPREF1991_03007 [Hoylesella loescheii DSM 19665 = JCM 12249 = ATCC 15930]